MNKLVILTISLVLNVVVLKGAVLIIDQNANAPAGTFSSFTLAQNAAVDGDTILVIPNTATYGNASITKPLTVIGVGFNPQTEMGIKSSFTNITINVNVTSGTKIIGLVVNSLNLGNTQGTISNVLIENSQLNILSHSATVISNVIIRQNLFQSGNNQIPITLNASNQSNIIVTNNIFSSGGTGYGPYTIGGGITYDHNLFLSSTRPAFYQISNCIVRNNIFFERNTTADLGYTNVVFDNNLSFNATSNELPPVGTNVKGTGNLVNQDPQLLNLPSGIATFDFTLDPGLGVGSPAIAAGTDGTELGIYGGSSPYKNTGSVLPVVKQFTMPTNVQEGTNTDATVIITGN
jgi:hypothetical protein